MIFPPDQLLGGKQESKAFGFFQIQATVEESLVAMLPGG